MTVRAAPDETQGAYMARAELWEALGEATDAVAAAVKEHSRAPTPQTRDVMDAAFRAYVRRLPLVIANAEAYRYEAGLIGYQKATERLEQLDARLSLLPSTDARDRKLQQQLTDELAAAGKTFERARVALDAALQRMRAHDDASDEKGRA